MTGTIVLKNTPTRRVVVGCDDEQTYQGKGSQAVKPIVWGGI